MEYACLANHLAPSYNHGARTVVKQETVSYTQSTLSTLSAVCVGKGHGVNL